MNETCGKVNNHNILNLFTTKNNTKVGKQKLEALCRTLYCPGARVPLLHESWYRWQLLWLNLTAPVLLNVHGTTTYGIVHQILMTLMHFNCEDQATTGHMVPTNINGQF